MNGGAGKGDTRRPSTVPEEEQALRWDYALRKDMLDATFEEYKRARTQPSTTQSKSDELEGRS